MSPDSVSNLLIDISWCGECPKRDLIGINGKADLYIIENGTLVALRYCNEILDHFVRPYARAIGPEFILMYDNARPQRAHITNAYLEQETIVCMDWPARSPDLNPIEHA